MKRISLSIIVPIYKVELYLEQCINSILQQDYKDFELILVDDGSPDGCPAICDKYANIDNRIIVIHKQNAGQTSARNAGLSVANGEFIGFVDGDDWIGPDMYSRLMPLIINSEADMGIVGYVEDYGNRFVKKCGKAKSGIYENEKLITLLRSMLYTGTYYEQAVIPAVWNKVFRRRILENNVGNINPEIRMGEDSACTYSCLLDTRKIIIENDINSYHYRIRSESMSRAFDDKYFDRTTLLFKFLDDKFSASYIGDVSEQLKYYKLFMLQYGITKLINTKTISILKKNKKIKQVVRQYKTKELVKSLQFDGFTREQKQNTRLLLTSSFFLSRYYINLILQKIKKM